VKIAIKQLKRRVSKLEAQAAASAQAEMRVDIRKLFEFLTSSEIEEFVRLLESGDHPDHPASREIMLRSSTRREQYPLLWEGLHRHRSGHPRIPKLWSVEAEIQALRDDVVLMWERRGLALDLDALTTDDLTILDHLQPKWGAGLAYWDFVWRIAKPTEIDAVLAKVLLVARAIDPYNADFNWKTTAWENVGRPLNWHDLRLDPATFPWDKWRKQEGGRKAEDTPWRPSRREPHNN